MSKKHILLINDMAGYGKVATVAMIPILSYMGHLTSNLPTMLISNNFEFGKFNILDTTDYMLGVLPVWKELGLRFDAIATGYIVNDRQAALVSDFCREQAAQGTPIYVDPIMADHGKLYNGVSADHIGVLGKMVAVSDLTYPNYTEACLLTDTEYKPEGVSIEEANRMLDQLHAVSGKSVLITSIPVAGQHGVVGYNHKTQNHFMLPYNEIPVAFPGTGDIFSAVLIGHLLDGEHLKKATRKAMDAVYRLIDANKDQEDKRQCLPLECCLNLI